MTIQEALIYGRSQLQQTSPTPALDARLLLQHVLQVEHSFLVAHDDVSLTAVQTAQYHQLIARARQKEPIPYLIGIAPFYGCDFQVTPAVLIPRPETELLVEKALHWARQRQAANTAPPIVVDIGTGSGCIAITLARHLPQAQVIAVDISTAALTIAQTNAQRLAPGRVQFQHGSLLSPVTHAIDLILANLPYITDQEWTDLDDGVKLYEPAVALKGGRDGLDLIKNLLHQATAKLNPDGAILLEIGWRQGAATQELAQTCFPTARVQVLSDLAGHDRIVMISDVA
ncbi:MAG: peptide chain release factor N(5)-glutamine methyltransferase [Anaerolineales bacterium]|nr:peptide chain release factor N(5)-glutamine methyltransferase [Anaerolineales bacterium]